MIFRYFCERHENLRVIKSGLSEGAQLIFRRMKDGRQGLFLPTGANQDYPDAQELIISQGPLPAAENDWEFYKRNHNELIIMEGGRQESSILELSQLRVFSKKTNTSGLFRSLLKVLKKACPLHGLETKSGYIYKDIFYSPAIKNFTLCFNLNSRAPSHILVSPYSSEKE